MTKLRAIAINLTVTAIKKYLVIDKNPLSVDAGQGYHLRHAILSGEGIPYLVPAIDEVYQCLQEEIKKTLKNIGTKTTTAHRGAETKQRECSWCGEDKDELLCSEACLKEWVEGNDTLNGIDVKGSVK